MIKDGLAPEAYLPHPMLWHPEKRRSGPHWPSDGISMVAKRQFTTDLIGRLQGEYRRAFLTSDQRPDQQAAMDHLMAMIYTIYPVIGHLDCYLEGHVACIRPVVWPPWEHIHRVCWDRGEPGAVMPLGIVLDHLNLFDPTTRGEDHGLLHDWHCDEYLATLPVGTAYVGPGLPPHAWGIAHNPLRWLLLLRSQQCRHERYFYDLDGNPNQEAAAAALVGLRREVARIHLLAELLEIDGIDHCVILKLRIGPKPWPASICSLDLLNRLGEREVGLAQSSIAPIKSYLSKLKAGTLHEDQQERGYLPKGVAPYDVAFPANPVLTVIAQCYVFHRFMQARLASPDPDSVRSLTLFQGVIPFEFLPWVKTALANHFTWSICESTRSGFLDKEEMRLGKIYKDEDEGEFTIMISLLSQEEILRRIHPTWWTNEDYLMQRVPQVMPWMNWIVDEVVGSSVPRSADGLMRIPAQIPLIQRERATSDSFGGGEDEPRRPMVLNRTYEPWLAPGHPDEVYGFHPPWRLQPKR